MKLELGSLPKRRAAMRKSGYWRDKTLLDHLARVVAQAPGKTAVVASSMIAAKRPYAVLVTLARKNTVALSETTQELEESGVETFSTVIPLREDLRTYFGGALGEDLYGYEDVYAEIKQKLEVE